MVVSSLLAEFCFGAAPHEIGLKRLGVRAWPRIDQLADAVCSLMSLIGGPVAGI
jgi:hypothetical protein